METIDPHDQTNQKVTNELLEKSKLLKQKSQATKDKLDDLKIKSDKIIQEQTEETSK